MYKNKFEINYWLRKIYTSKLFQLLPFNKEKLSKKIFTSIYKSNHWVQNSSRLPNEFVSVSGHGSNINTEQHKLLVKNFTEVINKYEINSILDMPCGDFLWIKEIIKNNQIKYLGIDIVDELIKKNLNQYKSDNINFLTKNIIDFSENTHFDLIIIRDLFIHINNSQIRKILHNLKKLNFKYLALNSYNNEENKDVIIGQHRKVNLLIDPFNLNKPIYSFKDYENDKFIFLYEKKNFI